MVRHNTVFFFFVIVFYCSFVTPKIAYSTEQKKTDEEMEKGGLPHYIRPGFVRKGRGPRGQLYEKILDNVGSKIPIELDLFVEEEDDRLKRYDDYGHMRFGKRGGDEQFDDYGHMRFGRSI